MVRLGSLSVGDAGAAAELLSASHAEYPAFRHLLPDPAVRARVLRPFLMATARDAAQHGHGLVARIDGRIVGVALWMPPGTFPLSLRRKVRMMPAMVRAAAAGRARFAGFAKSGAALERALPPGPAWYLETLGVHPEAQGLGVGAALVAAGLAEADAAGLPSHLHTSDPANIDYYRRWGFDLTQPGFETFPGGPTYYGMTRGAQTRAG